MVEDTEARTLDAVDVPDPEERRIRRKPSGVHMSREARAARGAAARVEVPPEAHAVFAPTALRPDPVELLGRQAVTRVPELVPIRYGRMLESEFTFYRGAALVMAADLAGTPTSGLRSQLCGDAHLTNFGMFGSPERRLVFDLNDFDETLPGPFEWDVKRLAASIEVAARDNEIKPKARRRIVQTAIRQYRTAMLAFAGESNLAVWYAHMDVEKSLVHLRQELTAADVKIKRSQFAKARTRDNLQAFSKLTTIVDGHPVFLSDPPLLVPLEHLLPAEAADRAYAALRELIRQYQQTLQSDRRHLLEQFQLLGVAHKVVGVGSVGTRAWILLFEGVDHRDPLLLQAKEAQASVLEEYAGVSEYTNSGQRVVAGQHLMQANSDILLGWQRSRDLDGIERDYYVRQLRDWKGSLDVARMSTAALTIYGRMCGWTLARAHACSGDRVAIASYLGSTDEFETAVAEFAVAYADQNAIDHGSLYAASLDGRIDVQRGV